MKVSGPALLGLVILLLLLHPTVFVRLLWHSVRYGHRWSAHIENFRYDVWCADCDAVFLDEVRE